jgi:hypothetical protein
MIRAVATSGKGVLETHEELVRETLARVRANLAGNQAAITLTAVHRAERERDEDVIRRHIENIRSVPDVSADPSTLSDDETEPQDDEPDTDALYGDLVVEEELELPFQRRDMVGTRPVHVLDAELDGDRIRVDLVVDRLSGGEPRRFAVLLVNRPVDEEAVPRHTSSSAEPVRQDVTSSLPDKIDIQLTPTDEPTDLHPIWYGVAGVAGGALIGMLLGFIVFY